MDVAAVVQALQAAFPDCDVAARAVSIDDTFVTLPVGALRTAIELLHERFDLYHLSTITGIDTGEAVEILYHFWDRRGLTLRIVLPYDALHVASVTDLIPGAAFYEREIIEMLDVMVEGHPDPRPMLLPDDWDEGAPLRKQTEAV
ncbi:MAG TPA: NADH-quinone oxidoreductase subunit C [Chloroflexi bacterium]|nr:NADH-quinone oxidoreductase subunit C [Chloroflexota bacterium]